MAHAICLPASPNPRPIHPWPFILAMIGGPLIVTLCLFWVFLIPVFALIAGGPFYIILGSPVLLIWLTRHAPDVDEISILALLTHASLFGSLWLILTLFNSRQAELAAFYAIAGLIFAPLWGAVTGWLYICLTRETNAKSTP